MNNNEPNKSTVLNDCINTFRPNPLSEENFFYYENTAKFRSTSERIEWHDKIFKRIECQKSKVNILFSSQMGCGKSTELNLLSKKLKDNNYLVEKIEVPMELDSSNIHYIDLIMLITYKIMYICESLDIKTEKNNLAKIENIFSSKIIQQEETQDSFSNLATEASIGFSFKSIISLLGKVTSSINLSSSQKIAYVREIEPKMSDIISTINELVKLIMESNKNNYKNFFPIFIIDQLEKCSLSKVKELFENGVHSLINLNISLIMTCPLALKRSPDFNFISPKFDIIENLPMIMVINKDGQDNLDAIQMLKELISKRADLQLFDDNILELLIKSTGGCLRDLFYVIREASFEAYLRGNDKVTEDIAKIFLERLSKDIFLRIEPEYYDKVRELYNTKCKLNNELSLISLIYTGAVFEYGYQDWCDLHPLVRLHYSLISIQ